MPEPDTLLPLTHWEHPDSNESVQDIVRQAYAEQTPLYPVGGGVSLDYGLPARQPGVGLSLQGLNRIVDYPARDLTATVEAGVTLSQLNQVLAQEGQCLPIEAPHGDKATLGGITATAWCGPRRYSTGSVRDFVIGVSAVDGRGESFRGGGRVVKNVAGYDFCKLLTGSLGTLGVITELTFKLRPIPQRSALLACAVADYNQAEGLLASLVHSKTTPAAIELLSGPAWSELPGLAEIGAAPHPRYLVVGFSGSDAEVDWSLKTLRQEWKQQQVEATRVWEQQEAAAMWSALTDFSEGDSALTLKATSAPSGTGPLMQQMEMLAPGCSLQAHAGNGVILARYDEFPAEGLSRTLIRRLLPQARAHHGSVVILKNPSGSEMTAQACWGGGEGSFDLMRTVKQQFDPRNLLNPGRFVV
ncbi:FAD-binding oxidoreductase [Lignipirellula cremea]|uniref:Putative FAD-linked oxidoreductase n=1 Tax=Lignipirellula cremea TaxID=2528010 RepID=A0A518DR31_9BACT|nr:FAD-binding oxidoreductase [Lignipirellula cremea]QDU94291.1 putative FAD-linked oxidoreductase [Lignipirellula cremea]